MVDRFLSRNRRLVDHGRHGHGRRPGCAPQQPLIPAAQDLAAPEAAREVAALVEAELAKDGIGGISLGIIQGSELEEMLKEELCAKGKK